MYNIHPDNIHITSLPYFPSKTPNNIALNKNKPKLPHYLPHYCLHYHTLSCIYIISNQQHIRLITLYNMYKYVLAQYCNIVLLRLSV